MIADVNLFGMFFDVALITALVAVAAVSLLRRLLGSIGVYQWVWHPALFDIGVFAMLWFALAEVASRYHEHLVHLLG